MKNRIGIEKASSFGWERYVSENGIMLGINGIDSFGASGNGEKIIREYGFTVLFRYILRFVFNKLGINTQHQITNNEFGFQNLVHIYGFCFILPSLFVFIGLRGILDSTNLQEEKLVSIETENQLTKDHLNIPLAAMIEKNSELKSSLNRYLENPNMEKYTNLKVCEMNEEKNIKEL